MSEIVHIRQFGDSLAEIAEAFGCHRRTPFSSLDRSASLLAGIDPLTGCVHARIEERRRSRKFIDF